MGSLSLLQWIVPTQESNQALQHCRWVLYLVSYQGSLDYKPDQAHTHLRAVQLTSSLHFCTVRGHRQPEAGPARLIILVLLLSTQSSAISTQH